MRILLLLIVIVNLGLFAFGRGYLGVPPSEAGRAPLMHPPINSHLLKLGEPTLNVHQAR